MSENSEMQVLAADRLDGDVIVTFTDGRCGMYSAELLYSMLPQADELVESTKPADPYLVLAQSSPRL